MTNKVRIKDVAPRVSKSRMESLNMCKRMWFYNYVIKAEQKESTAALRGTHTHRFFEEFYDKIDVNVINKLSDTREVVEYLVQVCGNLRANDELFIKYVTDTYIQNWIKFNIKKLESNDGTFFPMNRELKLAYKNITGYIDRVEHNTDTNEIIIIDYKPSLDWVKRTEIVFYANLYNLTHQENPATRGYFYAYKTGKTTKLWEFGDVDFENTSYRIDEYLNYKGPFPCEPSYVCRFCDYSERCSSEVLKDFKLEDYVE